jgi:hypothetical protein
MAERRMFSKRIINSARFLKMPISSQALYFHLGLHADDDGVVEAYTVMQSVGVGEDDLRVLCSKGFVKVLNEDLVSYITDWRENNKLRADRKIDSIYKNLLLEMLPEIELLKATNRADRPPRFPNEEMGRPAIENGTPQYRIVQDSTVQDSTVQGSSSREQESDPDGDDTEEDYFNKLKYFNKNVILSEDQVADLLEKMGLEVFDYYISKLSTFIDDKGARVKNHYQTILKWWTEDSVVGVR